MLMCKPYPCRSSSSAFGFFAWASFQPHLVVSYAFHLGATYSNHPVLYRGVMLGPSGDLGFRVAASTSLRKLKRSKSDTAESIGWLIPGVGAFRRLRNVVSPLRSTFDVRPYAYVRGRLSKVATSTPIVRVAEMSGKVNRGNVISNVGQWQADSAEMEKPTARVSDDECVELERIVWFLIRKLGWVPIPPQESRD